VIGWVKAENKTQALALAAKMFKGKKLLVREVDDEQGSFIYE
jgi:hypothetical protein